MRLGATGHTPAWWLAAAAVLLAATAAAALGPGPALALVAGTGAMIAVVRAIPEAFLGLLMISGPLASTTLVPAGPVGLTTIAVAGVLASIAYHGWRRRDERFRPPVALVPFALLAALLLAASFHSPDLGAGLEKAATFETITALAFLAPLVIIDGRRSLVRLAAVLAVIGLGVALLAEETGHPSHPLVLPGSDNEIFVGQFTGLGLIAIAAVLWPLTPGLWRLLWVPPAALMVPPLVGAGSRGALLGTAIAVALGLGLLLARRQTRLPAAAVLLALAVAAPAVWAASPPAARAKYSATLGVDRASDALDAGGGERREIVTAAVDLFRDNPEGVGTAGYPALTGYEWPHNIVLELGAELGVIGVALFLALLGAVAAGLVPAIRGGSVVAVGAAALAVAPLVLAMSSFDINNNRTMWLMLGVALAASRIPSPRPAPDPAPVGVPGPAPRTAAARGGAS